MNVRYKYYRWRASRAKSAAKTETFRLKAYRATVRKRWPFGLDLTDAENPLELKKRLTADTEPDPEKFKVGYNNEHQPGKYADGTINVWVDEGGNVHDDTVWKEIPQWWADVPEANQQHQPTYRTPQARSTFTKFDPKTGKRTYWRYNYKTGKQEEV